ncbi:galactoside alpha-(1,2)-fucosyltransferase 1 [Patella vulgata]|uniref:galactoside alpha-(1,2)-fucosyltransferase 1 n=1 Tax=Patella vulgata TaxID=6465 RepID=UPI00217F7862|nr:galactoside alpha-(1,2)-fucosyltransferase 1 [Patella vulgata]
MFIIIFMVVTMRRLPLVLKQTVRHPEFLKIMLLTSLVFNFFLIAILNSRMYGTRQQPIHIQPSSRDTLEWPRHTLCIYFEGGLGNNLFQYASTFGIAKNKSMGVIISRRSYILTLFDMRVLTYNHVCECKRRKVIIEKKPCRFDSNVYNFSPSRDYRIRNFLQSWKYFENSMEDIRHQFVIKNHFRQKAHDMIQQYVTLHFQEKKSVIPKNLIYVGIHIRRGDYLKKKNKAYGYRTAPKSYIYKSIQYFHEKHDHVIFLVCSNDLKWARKVLNGRNDIIYVTRNRREIDFAILTSMNHSITTVGTFSWWSGFLANGTVIYFKNFIAPNTPLRREFSLDFEDFFLPHWIPM